MPSWACGVAAGLSIRRSRVQIPPRVVTERNGRVAEWQTPQAQNLVSCKGRAGSSPASATDALVGAASRAALLRVRLGSPDLPHAVTAVYLSSECGGGTQPGEGWRSGSTPDEDTEAGEA